MTWTQRDILKWLKGLSSSVGQQLLIVRDLMAHASTDQMSSADRVVCRRAIKMLMRQVDKARAA
jgi:hypothetical protein